jgi:hypothetical protein
MVSAGCVASLIIFLIITSYDVQNDDDDEMNLFSTAEGLNSLFDGFVKGKRYPSFGTKSNWAQKGFTSYRLQITRVDCPDR